MRRELLLIWIAAFFVSHVYGQSLKIGIVADCQYCDCDYSSEWNNDYRKSLDRLKEAVDTFNSNEVDLVFHLGDLIDRNIASYDSVMPIMQNLKMPYYFVLGNHDFSVEDGLKKKVYKRQNLEKPYYVVQNGGWLFVVLDGTEISQYHSSNMEEVDFANKEMQRFEQLGRPQAKPWNGAISEKQITWLETQLTKADTKGLKVIVLCHFPVLPKADVNLWNDEELVKKLEMHPSVKAYFNGHEHKGNYAEKEGIHYLTFKGMVRSQNQNAYSIVKLSATEINVKGFGREESRILDISK